MYVLYKAYMLELKGLITTEHTKIKTRDGIVHNGSLLYTLQPIEPIEERYFQKVLAEQASKNAVQNALARYKEKRANTMKGPRRQSITLFLPYILFFV